MLHYAKSFLPQHMKRQVKELFIATTTVNFALAMVMLFEPIYLYNIGYPLQKIMLFYLIAYALYFFIIPLGASFAKRHGYEPGMFIGTSLFIVYYISLFLIATYPWLFFFAPIILAIQKTFYWPAYHADFADFSDDREKGRQISVLNASTALVYIIGPGLAGFIISQWGFGALFTFASIIFLASNIATMVTKEKFKPEKFPYKKSYKKLFSKENRKSLFAYMGFGEEVVVLIVWPVFISIVIANAFNLGMIVTLATLVTTLVTLYVGKISDKRNKKSVLSLGSIVYSLSWFIRIFVNSSLGVFFVDTLSRVGKSIVAVPLTAITYDRAKEVSDVNTKQNVMWQILFFEMSLVLGKLMAILMIYILLFFVGSEVLAFKITFIFAGGMTLLYMLL